MHTIAILLAVVLAISVMLFVYWAGHMAGALSVHRVQTGLTVTRVQISWLIIVESDESCGVIYADADTPEDDIGRRVMATRRRIPDARVRAFRATEIPVEEYGETEDYLGEGISL